VPRKARAKLKSSPAKASRGTFSRRGALALALGLSFLGALFLHQRRQLQVFHQVTVGESFAPFGRDASLTLDIANRGRRRAQGLRVELCWPGMRLSIMGGDTLALAPCQASFRAGPDGRFYCDEGALEAGQTAMLMFSVRRDSSSGPSMTPAPRPLSVRVLGQGFESEEVQSLASDPTHSFWYALVP
jgi:hypothetical protein